MTRILITGSRDWNNPWIIQDTLGSFEMDQNITLVSGNCPTGADMICESFADHMGWTVERHPADWKTQGKKAGFIRNKEMVDLGADVCMAFIKNESKGATMTARLAEEAGIETHIIRMD